ncbi:MerR family transcriptional regulator [Streptomyces phaeochromogenes]|uniref:MerR family transcriptional regulator n=1 Tax=Streptomyces phaeochromogenes TaxID=1923 RepID=A0ABZ1HRW6_STRPH|nr:MerR family transcriptional regulator [Streptomyces phaeochromogenes]WSD20216.1 MerR family transcriptional regulator [Streptomyces phaeochromogenes]
MYEPTGGRNRPDDPSPKAVEAADTGLTTGAVARRLGVSPTTLRSWDRRYGLGPAVRADGRHRRWTTRDVAMLEAMCRLTSAGVPPAEAARAARQGAVEERAAKERAVNAEAPKAPKGWDAGEKAVREPIGSPSLSPSHSLDRTDLAHPPAADDRPPTAGPPLPGDIRKECRGLARAAVRLDAPAVDGRLTSAVERYGLTAAWQDVMVPTLHAVGRRWESSGDRYVEVEHLLSWHISTTLRRVTPALSPSPSRRPETSEGPVVLACVPGEQHTLPLEALNAGLAEHGLPTRMFGAAVPAEALTAAVRRLGPSAVVLWAQARSTASIPLARHVAATHWGVKGARRHPTLVLGGPGWAGRSAQGMLRPSSLHDALAVLAARYENSVPGPRTDGLSD